MKIINIKQVIEDLNQKHPLIEIYKCGSINECNFLKNNNCIPIDNYIHSNGKTIWLFLHTPMLSELLSIWTENNPNKKCGKRRR